jgi:hypothetical protein
MALPPWPQAAPLMTTAPLYGAREGDDDGGALPPPTTRPSFLRGVVPRLLLRRPPAADGGDAAAAVAAGGGEVGVGQMPADPVPPAARRAEAPPLLGPEAEADPHVAAAIARSEAGIAEGVMAGVAAAAGGGGGGGGGGCKGCEGSLTRVRGADVHAGVTPTAFGTAARGVRQITSSLAPATGPSVPKLLPAPLLLRGGVRGAAPPAAVVAPPAAAALARRPLQQHPRQLPLRAA